MYYSTSCAPWRWENTNSRFLRFFVRSVPLFRLLMLIPMRRSFKFQTGKTHKMTNINCSISGCSSRLKNQQSRLHTIALASVISKVVEKILLTRMSDLLITTCIQFGFKSKLGTDTCIYICSQRNCGKPSKLEWFYVYGFS